MSMIITFQLLLNVINRLSQLINPVLRYHDIIDAFAIPVYLILHASIPQGSPV